jgi:hypothetical protein
LKRGFNATNDPVRAIESLLNSRQHNWHALWWGSVRQSIIPSLPQSWYLVAWTVLTINPWKGGSMQPMILWGQLNLCWYGP